MFHVLLAVTVFIFSVYVCTLTRSTARMWRFEDNVRELVLAFHQVDLETGLKSLGLAASAFTH